MAKSGAGSRDLHGKKLELAPNVIGAVLLARSRGASAVGAPRIFSRRGLRDSAFRSRGQLIIFTEARLNLIDDAKIADKFRAASIHKVRLAVRYAVHVDRREVSKLWLTERKTGSGKQNGQSCDKGDCAISEARGSDRVEPAKRHAPSLFGLARAERLIQDGIDELRRRFDLLDRMEIAQEMGNAGHKRHAVSASVYVEIESVTLIRAQKAVEVIAKTRFGKFTSPGHE